MAYNQLQLLFSTLGMRRLLAPVQCKATSSFVVKGNLVIDQMLAELLAKANSNRSAGENRENTCDEPLSFHVVN